MPCAGQRGARAGVGAAAVKVKVTGQRWSRAAAISLPGPNSPPAARAQLQPACKPLQSQHTTLHPPPHTPDWAKALPVSLTASRSREVKAPSGPCLVSTTPGSPGTGSSSAPSAQAWGSVRAQPGRQRGRAGTRAARWEARLAGRAAARRGWQEERRRGAVGRKGGGAERVPTSPPGWPATRARRSQRFRP